MYRIQNEHLSVGIKESGAELASIKSLISNVQYLWQADPEHWGRHSCILFPVIGCVKEGKTKVGSQSYPMTKHGLVRNKKWQLTDHAKTKLIFSLQSDEESRKHYPYDFELKAIYQLEGLTCTIRYEVATLGKDRMPFNIGAHPAFNCPINKNLERRDYRLVFHESESQNAPIINDEGLIGPKKQLVLDHQKEVVITDDLFDHDALILENLNSTKLSLVDKSGKKHWTFDFGNCTHLGIWSANRQSPFVCIEPWFGVADHEDASGIFIERPAIQWVEPDEMWSYEHSVTIEE